MTEATRPRRGRPRPQLTIRRDARVAETLADGGKTRQQIVEQLGWPANIVYACLWRLRREGRVRKIDGHNVWELTPSE